MVWGQVRCRRCLGQARAGRVHRYGRNICAASQHAKNAKATIIENRPSSLDGTVRQVKLAVHDPVFYMSGMRMTPKAVEPRWLDNFQHPGQKLELTASSGEKVSVAICSSPSESRIDSGVGNFSVINVLVERDARTGCLATSEPDDVLEVSSIHGPGFANPVNEDIKLTTILEDKRPVVIVASGASGIGAARSAICWDALLASATERPVVVIYIVQSKESAAFMLEWDTWKEMGVHLFPLYISNKPDNEDDLGGTANGSASSNLLPQQDRILLQMETLFLKGGAVHELMQNRLQDAAALFSGLSPPESKAVLRCLKSCNISREFILQD